jgi:hypothetical protein
MNTYELAEEGNRNAILINLVQYQATIKDSSQGNYHYKGTKSIEARTHWSVARRRWNDDELAGKNLISPSNMLERKKTGGAEEEEAEEQ